MELLDEPTREFNKNMFFESLHNYNKPIALKCVAVSEVTKNKMNNKPSIYLNMEILKEFPIIKQLENKDTVKINPLNHIINLPYSLKETRANNIYSVSNSSNLYPLLNYCLIKNKLIPSNNSKGFNISVNEIKDNLTGMVFNNIRCILQKETNYKPYYKLIIEV